MRKSFLVLALLATGCGPGLATRYEDGNRALSAGDGAMYFVVLSPRLQRALNECIPSGMAGASPVLVLVVDVDADGVAHDLDIEPDSPGTDCLALRLTERALPRPPLAPGAARFPIGLKIETR